MLTVSDIAPNQTCAGLSRRNFLQAGVLGSLALPDLLANKALAAETWRLETVDIRAHARDRHRSVDDTPFGGGSGMVMRADVTAAAAAARVLSDTGSLQPYSEASGKSGSEPLALSPRRMPPTLIALPRDRASSGSGSGHASS